VEGDRIQVRDLAAALPEFSTAPADAMVGQAPLPGARRTFHAPELRALAHRFGVALSSGDDICFEWPSEPLDRGRAVAAMQQSLQVPGAAIEIKEATSERVPRGRIEFPLSSLGTPSSTGSGVPVLWRGDVVYGEGQRFAVWARVQIAAPCQKLTAAESLKAGRPVDARQIRATATTCFPVAGKGMPTVSQIAGMSPIHSIAAGTELRPDLLTAPNDINRGDAVQIEVRSGAALLVLTGRALTAGRSGDTISVRNPDSNKTFQARITGKGTATVEAGIPRGI
jgi:flagella basal body P-ring formation protein FlgA